jgi:toxin FitB
MAMSVITVAEIEGGVQLVERRDPRQGALIRLWAQGVFSAFAQRMAGIDADIARKCGGLHVPDRRPERDAWIAATALVRGCSVVTRNVRDFAPMGVATISPWSP